MENKVKHLEMIQGIINRMAMNSFALKGWAVTLVAGIFALSSNDSDKIYFLIAYVPIIVFLWVRCLLFITRAVVPYSVQYGAKVERIRD